MFIRHETIEKNVILMVVLTLITVSIGGLVQIIPLFTIESTIERVEGVRPYTPLELAGRNIYLREGCYLCHSQQVRPFKDEVERYGHYSLAAESLYDHPFQWGSKRTGPDLARVGGRYSNDWHVAHLASPRAVVPESIMPAYPFLAERRLDQDDRPRSLVPRVRLPRLRPRGEPRPRARPVQRRRPRRHDAATAARHRIAGAEKAFFVKRFLGFLRCAPVAQGDVRAFVAHFYFVVVRYEFELHARGWDA